MKSRKRLARDVFDTFASYAGLVYDVTDTDCCAQNNSTHGHLFSTFKRRFFKKRDEKSSEKLKFKKKRGKKR